jgi:hypothetical protein
MDDRFCRSHQVLEKTREISFGILFNELSSSLRKDGSSAGSGRPSGRVPVFFKKGKSYAVLSHEYGY